MVGRLIVLSVACLFAFFLGGADPGQCATPIKIAMITAKTGEAGPGNIVSFEGARFAVEEINRRGGILGRPVKLLEYDNLSTPEGSAAAARQAIADGAVAVVGCNWSSHSMAMAEVLQAAQIPMITHMSTNPKVTRVGDYIFRACFTDSFQGYGLARFAYDELNAETASLLVDKSRTYSVDLGETFEKAFMDLGGRIVQRVEYDTSKEVDFNAIIRDVANQPADALFIPGGYKDISSFVAAARDLGLRNHLLSADGVGIKIYDFIGDKADGLYFSGHWSRWVDTSESRKFVRQFEEQVGQIIEDTVPLTYDSFMLLANAMERAGSTMGGKVRDALANTAGYKGVTGVIRFNDHGDPIKPMVINQFRFRGIMYKQQVAP